MICAAIDVGTNSVRLLITEKQGHQLKNLYKDMATTRIGQGISKSTLQSEAINRTADAIEKFYKKAQSLYAQKIYIFATSAVRDARNKEEFLAAVKDRIAVVPEIISGETEAKLSFIGAVSALEQKKQKDAVVIDIGGGSTEIIFEKNGVLCGTSLPVGAVRMAENKMHYEELKKLFLPIIQDVPYQKPTIIGVGGTVTSLAAVEQKLTTYDPSKIHGYYLKTEAVHRIAEMLKKLTLEERKKITGLQPERADIIPYGADILCAVLDAFLADGIVVSESDLLEGRILTEQ